ncbi:MAG: hypothetical protein MI757_10000, partial [Pirellulales bacterium]|nr:hypothetical protein [Pirellulales bacterium]
FGEEMKQSDAAVLARLVERAELPKDPTASAVPGAVDSKFEIVDVLKGRKLLGDNRELKAVYFGKDPIGTQFLIMGVEPPALKWSAPIKLSDRGVEYVRRSTKLPEKGPDRLAFFQDYLNDKDAVLAQDAYDEFAKAEYDEVKALKPQMKRKQLLEWIQDPEMSASKRRLFFTMLGVCGQKEDIALLERMLKSDNKKDRTGLDSMIASYLTLKGPEGMGLIEDLFIKNDRTPFTETYKAIMALRFLGEDQSAVPRKRVLQALRLMLERPKYADLVIPDLARWEDWEAMPRLVKLFKEATKENSWVRVPVLRYLNACPLPESDAYAEELAKLDPAAARRAASFFPLTGAQEEDDKDEEKSSEKGDAPATTKTPKSASETAAPTATSKPTTRRVQKPTLVAESTPRDRDETALLVPIGVSSAEAEPSMSVMHLLLVFFGGASVLAFAMWTLLCRSARYEKIAKHGVRRK